MYAPFSCDKKTTIGDNVYVNELHISGNGECTIGNNCVFAGGIAILTENHNYDTGETLPFDNTYTYRKVTIEDNVWVGSQVIILPGTTIREGAVIQAGAVVHGDIPPLAIVGGNPAKVFKYRDKDHYNKLKTGGKFIHFDYSFSRK